MNKVVLTLAAVPVAWISLSVISNINKFQSYNCTPQDPSCLDLTRTAMRSQHCFRTALFFVPFWQVNPVSNGVMRFCLRRSRDQLNREMNF